MHFPDEPTLADRMAILAASFRYRIGPMIVLALLMAREAPGSPGFGFAILGWAVFEVFVKLYFELRKP